MAYDAFLKIEGIEGESNDRVHPREIEISSFSWGVTNTGSVSGGGGGAGKAVPQDFHFTMPLSIASPSLMLSCAIGRHLQRATLTCRKAGGSGFEFLKITLYDALVSSYQVGGVNRGQVTDDVPRDEISLAFAKIDVLYSVERTGETVESAFDFRGV